MIQIKNKTINDKNIIKIHIFKIVEKSIGIIQMSGPARRK